MKNALLLMSLISFVGFSQSINHPTGKTSAIATLNSGKTFSYYDDGGQNENYHAGTKSTLTIYPSKEGEYVSLNCKFFEIASDCRMYIFDGNHPGATILKYVSVHSGKSREKFKPGEIITASAENSSGALTIRFVNSVHRATMKGWDFAVSSVKTPGPNPRKTTQDCSGAIKVCSDDQITTKSSGAGYQELPGPHFWNTILNYDEDGENQSNWYKFEVASPGTIEFLIRPKTHTDFDWALWGPYPAHECPAWTNDKALRLSAADGDNSRTGITGLSSRASDKYEDSPGDGFLAPLQVKKGQHYVLMIDDWSGNKTEFDLKWSLLNGASLECKKDKEPPVIPDEDAVVIEMVDTTTVEEIVEVVEVDCSDKIQIKGEVFDISADQPGAIDVEAIGTTALKYQWYDTNGSKISTQPNLLGAKAGNYEIEVTDTNGCAERAKFTVKIKDPVEPVNEGPKLEAEISQDQSFVTVSYPGAFEYKIENMNQETVITGHSVNSDEVEITRLPPGKYRVSLIYKKIKQYDEFEKK